MIDPFDDRLFSSFPLSIPTGIMLESLFNPTFSRYDETRTFNKLKVDDYKYHIFNVYTLIRNIFNAVKIKNKDTLFYSKRLLPVLIEEINTIKSLYENTKCQPLFFMPEYFNVSKHLNSGKPTGITKTYEDTLKLSRMLKIGLKKPEVGIQLIEDFKLPKSQDKILITTHIAVDLINYKNIPNLLLLESHTGVLKERKDWDTKYHAIGKKPLSVFPFTEELLYILGDSTIVNSEKLTIRIDLFNIAMENKWSFRTTKDKILNDIKNNSKLYELIKNYKSIF